MSSWVKLAQHSMLQATKQLTRHQMEAPSSPSSSTLAGSTTAYPRSTARRRRSSVPSTFRTREALDSPRATKSA